MGLSLLLALQAAAVSAPPVVPIEFDLAAHRPVPRGCWRGNGSEIVVCGQRGGGVPFDMAEMERRYAPRKIRAETGLKGGGVARAFTESVEMPRGVVSKRALVGIKLPF